MVKMYKGFNKDMTCNGFQYEEGKEYTCNEARLCECGFHACEMPLDCFKYYTPGKSVYHEVELGDMDERKDDDSKRCGKKIKIGAKLEIADIVKAQIEFTREHADNAGGDCSINAGSYYSTNAGDDCSTNAGGDCSINAGGNNSTNAGGYYSTNAGSYYSTNAGGNGSTNAGDGRSINAGSYYSTNAGDDCSTNAGGDCSINAGGDWSTNAGGNCSTNAGGNNSTNAGGNGSINTGGNGSTNAGGDCSTNAGGNNSTNAGGNGSTNAGGENSLCVCWSGKCKGGVGSLLVIGHRYFSCGKCIVDGYAHGIVDGEKIKADTWYEYKDGELVEVVEDD